jgi:hypothetical protein
MSTTEGKIIAERALVVTHEDDRVNIHHNGKRVYAVYQDGWTTEREALREYVKWAYDTTGTYTEVIPEPLHHNGTGWTKGAGHYTVRLRVKN